MDRRDHQGLRLADQAVGAADWGRVARSSGGEPLAQLPEAVDRRRMLLRRGHDAGFFMMVFPKDQLTALLFSWVLEGRCRCSRSRCCPCPRAGGWSRTTRWWPPPARRSSAAVPGRGSAWPSASRTPGTGPEVLLGQVLLESGVDDASRVQGEGPDPVRGAAGRDRARRGCSPSSTARRRPTGRTRGARSAGRRTGRVRTGWPRRTPTPPRARRSAGHRRATSSRAAEVVGGELHLVPPGVTRQRRRHDARAVDEDAQRAARSRGNVRRTRRSRPDPADPWSRRPSAARSP